MKSPVLLWILALAIAGSAGSAPEGPPYYLVFLRPNPNRIPLRVELREAIMAQHMANIQRMADEGILAAAGPMDDPTPTISGIFILKADSLEAARAIAARDPTVVANRNTVDVHAWRGPEGIGDGYFKWKRDNPGAKDVMAARAFCILEKAPNASGWRPDDTAFIETVRASGALLAAGRVEGEPVIVGIIIFKTASADEAARILAKDPAVASGRFQAEFHNWWTADRVMPW